MDLSTTIEWQFFTVDIHLSGSIVADAEPDPGILSWSGSAWYHVSAEDYDDEDYPELDQPPRWEAAVTKGYALSLRDQDEDFAHWKVLAMHGVVVDPYLASSSIPRELDGISADYGSLARILSGNELHPDLLDMIEGAGSRAILIDRVGMAPAWRRLGGVGRLLISRILRMFTTVDTAVVATIPFTIDLYENANVPATLTNIPASTRNSAACEERGNHSDFASTRARSG
ncbi:hypothetical protein OH799_07160 [Nocardia sp. NBC_00881]|uniref:hypothetical protein n=1 Tax=Nocardia sp. NBC_00881 TaxID=2975995 RepID=UPI00386DAC5E|nr:hypothetical protein OH799_07160 [Nocardia sp. NBC_00881]